MSNSSSVVELVSNALKGDILYMTALGRPVIVLNKFEHARELMEKHSAIYSDRPRMEYIVEM